MLQILAHTDEPVTAASEGFLDTIAHQPPVIAMVISIFVLLGWFGILGLFKIKLPTRLLLLLPVILALSLLFFVHNPFVVSVLLSSGFILVFILTFTMIRAGH